MLILLGWSCCKFQDWNERRREWFWHPAACVLGACCLVESAPVFVCFNARIDRYWCCAISSIYHCEAHYEAYHGWRSRWKMLAIHLTIWNIFFWRDAGACLKWMKWKKKDWKNTDKKNSGIIYEYQCNPTTWIHKGVIIRESCLQDCSCKTVQFFAPFSSIFFPWIKSYYYWNSIPDWTWFLFQGLYILKSHAEICPFKVPPISSFLRKKVGLTQLAGWKM